MRDGGCRMRFTERNFNQYEAERISNATFKPIQSLWGHFAGRGIKSADNQFMMTI